MGRQHNKTASVCINHMGVVLRNLLFGKKNVVYSHAFLNQYILSETELDTFWCKFVHFKVSIGILLDSYYVVTHVVLLCNQIGLELYLCILHMPLLKVHFN